MGRRVIRPRGRLGLLWAASQAWDISRHWSDHLCLRMEEGEVYAAAAYMALLVFLLIFGPAVPAVAAAAMDDEAAAGFAAGMGFLAVFLSLLAYGITKGTIEDVLCCGDVEGASGDGGRSRAGREATGGREV